MQDMQDMILAYFMIALHVLQRLYVVTSEKPPFKAN